MEILRLKISQLQTLEYGETPRGRVIYTIDIATFFELDFNFVVWKKDPHYRT